MDEADPGTVCPRPRHRIEQLGAAIGGLLEGGPDIVAGVRDVVDGFAAILQELLHTGIRIERHDQLDPALADRDHRDLDAFALEPLASRRAQPQPALVDPNRLVEIADGDPDMVDPAQHGVDSKRGEGATRSASRVDKSCTACVRSSTVSYVTVRPPLFTRRPLRPSVDG